MNQINDENFDIVYEKSLQYLRERISEIEKQIGTIDDYKNFEYTEEERYQKYMKSIGRLGKCIEKLEDMKSQHGQEFPEKWENSITAYKNLYREFIVASTDPDYYKKNEHLEVNEDEQDKFKSFSFDLYFGELQPFSFEIQTEIKKIISDLIMQRRPAVPIFMFEPDDIFRYSDNLQTQTDKIEYFREILDEYNYFEPQFIYVLEQFILSLSQSKTAKIFELLLNIEFKEFLESNKIMTGSILNPHIPDFRNILDSRINSLERNRYVDDLYRRQEATVDKKQETTTYKQDDRPANKQDQNRHTPKTEDQKDTQQPLSKFYRVNDLCEMFNVSRNTIYNWMNSGQLPYSKMGNNRFVSEEDLNEALKRIDFTNWQEIPDIVMKRKYKKNR